MNRGGLGAGVGVQVGGGTLRDASPRASVPTPSAYNEDDPAGELPGSPLDPSPAPSGFRRAA